MEKALITSEASILNSAKATIALEGQSVLKLSEYITKDFAKAVTLIHANKGRVIITGVGKSAIIANKIVATLNSTGTPSIFMHAADAIHGDLGLVLENDIVICISKSGNTPEIKALVPLLKHLNNPIIAITGNCDSFLGKQAHYVLNTYVEKEACPNNLAPTTSTTAQLVIGDALAICLLNLRGFTSSDFAKFHPGGALGKKLFLKVADIAAIGERPQVYKNTGIKDVIIEISKKRLGVTAVIENRKIVGIITDGDLRRMLSENDHFSHLTAQDIMNNTPKCIDASEMATEAVNVLETYGISQLLVEHEGDYVGVVHLHDLIKEGII